MNDFLKDLQIADAILRKNKTEPFECNGYSIFTTPYVTRKIKGYKFCEDMKRTVLIRNILVNEPKRLITVVFVDGDHEIIKCSKEDHFDINIGVALAIAQHLYRSKNKFHKEVAEKTKIIQNEKKGKKKESCQKKN